MLGDLASLTYSPDGRLLMAGGPDGMLTIWPADEGLANAVVVTAGEGSVNPVLADFRDDGREIVTVLQHGRPLVWEIAPDALLDRACDMTRRDLTQEEWDAVLPDRPYQRTCTGI